MDATPFRFPPISCCCSSVRRTPSSSASVTRSAAATATVAAAVVFLRLELPPVLPFPSCPLLLLLLLLLLRNGAQQRHADSRMTSAPRRSPDIWATPAHDDENAKTCLRYTAYSDHSVAYESTFAI